MSSSSLPLSLSPAFHVAVAFVLTVGARQAWRQRPRRPPPLPLQPLLGRRCAEAVADAAAAVVHQHLGVRLARAAIVGDAGRPDIQTANAFGSLDGSSIGLQGNQC